MDTLLYERSIDVYYIFNDADLKARITGLDTYKFNISPVSDEGVYIDRPRYSILFIEKAIFEQMDFDADPEDFSFIIVSDTQLNLKTGTVNRIPKDLFMTNYLDEFIYWVVEKTEYLNEIQSKNRHKNKKLETLLDELHKLSRQSVYYET